MSSDLLTQRLISKYNQDKLAHFYILKNCQLQSSEVKSHHLLQSWAKSFFSQIFHKSLEQTQIKINNGHSDILWLSPEYDKKKKSFHDYRVKDDFFESFLHFKEYKAIELKRLFIIVEQAHRINDTIANKMLKELEEPHNPMTIFFLNPTSQEFIPTISSRALELTINQACETFEHETQPLSNAQEIKLWLEKISHSFCEQLEEDDKKCVSFFIQTLEKYLANSEKMKGVLAWSLEQISSLKINEVLLINWWLEIEKRKKSGYLHKSKVLETSQWMDRSRVFHNKASTRQSELVSLLCQFD